MSKVDNYLIHAFDVAAERQSSGDTVFLPMLIQVQNLPWIPRGVPDYSEIARLGDLVICLGTIRTVNFLRNDPAVLYIGASRPSSGPDCIHSIPFIKADKVHFGRIAEIGKISEKGDQALIALIDTDMDVLHEAFLDSTRRKTRILAIWDQNDNTRSAFIRTKHSYGREHTQDMIDQYIQSGRVPPSLKRVSINHGTHVASIAAGRSIVGSRFPGGVAPEAKIVVVIPRYQVGPTDPYSVGYSASLVSALAYIDDFAKQLGLPVVVNLSQGINAGAHDGTSLIEAAFDKFTNGGRAPGRVVVKSAGNERNKGAHAKLSMSNNQTEYLEWSCPEPHDDLDVIELWFKAGDELDFCLMNPSGERSPWINRSNPNINKYFSKGNGYKISYERYHQDNGDSCLTIVISRGGANFVESGTWLLEIKSGSVRSQGDIHAWIERSNNHIIRFTNHLSEEMTLNIPGTARSVISVGSVATSIPFRVADYSSYGPTRDGRSKPELAAPGEQIEAAEANSFVGLKVDSGTSMAAPHVAGAIALLLSYWTKQKSQRSDWQQLNAAQIRAALCQTTQNYNGQWKPGMGFGVLDVEALLNTFG